MLADGIGKRLMGGMSEVAAQSPLEALAPADEARAFNDGRTRLVAQIVRDAHEGV